MPTMITTFFTKNYVFIGNSFQTKCFSLENVVIMVGSSTHFLRVYFSFGYYLSVVPFRFHRSKTNDAKIIINSSRLKKVICGIVHGLIWCGYSLSSFKEFQQRIEQTLDFYFFVLWRLFSIFYMLAFFETVWRHSSQYLNILTQLDRDEEKVLTTNELPLYGDVVGDLTKKRFHLKFTAKVVGTLVCTIYTIPPFLIILSTQLFTDTPTWDPYANLYFYATKAKSTFFFQNITSVDYENIPASMSPAEYASGLLYAVYQFFNYLRDYYSDLLLLTCVLTLRNLSRRFNQFLHKNKGATAADICRKYDLIRSITCQINAIMRISFGLLLLQAPSVFMSTVTQTHQTILSFLYGIFFTATFFLTLVLAAGIVDDMRQTKHWLRNGNNSAKLRSPELLLILEEIENSPFGVRGIGLPVMTFGFVRIVIMLMVTYGILMVQLQSYDNECVCLCPREG